MKTTNVLAFRIYANSRDAFIDENTKVMITLNNVICFIIILVYHFFSFSTFQ